MKQSHIVLPPGVGYVDTAYVKARLEAAGKCLMALPAHGTAPAAVRSAWPQIVRSVWEAYDATRDGPMRPPRPSAAAIDAMDEAFGWLTLLGDKAVETKRIIWLRLMIWPLSGKHLWPWRKAAAAVGLHRETLELRHGRGIGRIVTRLNCPGWKEPPGGGLP
jgi:hypothetical protein